MSTLDTTIDMPQNTEAQAKPAPSQENNNQNNGFLGLALPEVLQKAIKDLGYETPSPIQAQVIPPMLSGKDILGVAQTGTGKTAAFALPVLSDIDLRQRNPQVLCLAPTRELAIQVAKAFEDYAKHLKGFTVSAIYGGASYPKQIKELRKGAHVVVGTPGRVMDHMRRGTLILKDLKTLVLDEADEMLSMGFIDDIEWILESVPEDHQTALFSATMPNRIKKLADTYLNNPFEVRIKQKTTTASTIRQRYMMVRNKDKFGTLARVLEVEDFDGVLIFVRTKSDTLQLAEELQRLGFSAEALNGDMVQNLREKTIARLKSGGINILVATDVAARGLDVPRISHVINFDVPYDTESYVHRIGRTGRAGREGDAILFITDRETRLLKNIERSTRKQIERYEFPSVDVLNDRKLERLFIQIDETMQQDLKEYISVMKKYIVQNPETDPLILAAALASIEAKNKPFYLKASPKAPSMKMQRDDRKGRSKRDGRRDGRRDRDSGGHRGKRSGRNERAFDDTDKETFRLEVGESHGVRKGDIVGAIANEAGIESKFMGKIRMNNDHSFIDLPEGMPKHTFNDLKKVRVRGHKLDISRANA